MESTTEHVLVADVGGTHCRLALGRRDQGRIVLENLRVMPTPPANFEILVREYLAQAGCPQPAAVAVAAAGRVNSTPGRRWVALTNTPLVLERESLASIAGGRAWLVNDLGAVAAALPHLAASELRDFGPVRGAPGGRRLVLGVGTGLGASLLTEGGEPLDTESGHADLAAVSADEIEWSARLSTQGRVSVEHVLCGSGLLRLHEVVSGERLPAVDALLARWRAGDPDARTTLLGFSSWLGRVAGNLVLSLGAWGGVFLIGGVVAGLGDALDPGAFRAGFEDKAPFADDLARVPLQRIVHPQPALLGMAGLALTN
ncbi:glucokinase [Panacagrimonas perspica]|uniref:Glucokinase n=1 Tax=Panacagrimonas perspica TaxID=381431 RepID=A0A4S3K3D9_9GAMM|nr:glucokinase [Panacagrimonas perspica]TDU31198.1 glucokinase [Panacagrimonas perspica]THD02555.1 hypothetical protein B1810_13435 [Panacagrimonas perspica]